MARERRAADGPRRRGWTRRAEPAAAAASRRDPQRAALLQKLGEAYLRAPERYPTANVLAHEEIVPDTHILIRGDFKNKGEKVEPGFLSALNPGPPIDEPKGDLFVPQRRKALAQWLTSPDQPLLARVMVNRIWQGHFGRGIVGTPNDFGRQGDAPTHPELLDWLAVEFAERGWSIKQMHRLIMLSNTYRSSSVADEESLQKDPENHFLSRMNRRRLDGDAIRDTVLAVAGTSEPEDGRRGRDSAADEGRDSGGAHAGSVARKSRSSGAHPAQRLSADEAVADAADAADFRRAGYRDELRAAGDVHSGAAGAGADEQRVHGRAGGAVRSANSRSRLARIRRRRWILAWRIGVRPRRHDRRNARRRSIICSAIRCRGCAC